MLGRVGLSSFYSDEADSDATVPSPQPDRLAELLSAWLEQSTRSEARNRTEPKALKSHLTMLEGESANVIALVRKGLMSADDPQIENELGQIAAQKRAVAADIDVMERKPAYL